MRGYQDFKTPFLTLIFILVGLFLYSKVFGPIPFSVNSVNTQKADLFTATGTGNAAAVPDTALVSLGITSDGNSVDAAQNETNQVASRIISELKELGIAEEKIKTTNYSVNPRYGGDGQKITGYSVTQSLEVEIKPIERANQAVDIATQNGANLVDGVSFILNEGEREKLERKALKEGADKARKKAEMLAEVSGIRLGRVINIEQTSVGRGVVPLLEADKISTPENPTEITPGETKIEIEVILTFETL